MKRSKMRRKLFTFTAALIMLLAIIDGMGSGFPAAGKSNLLGQGREFEGVITSIEEKDRGLGMTIDIYEGNKRVCSVLMTYYGKIDMPFELTGCCGIFQGELRQPSARRNPGCFDYDRHLKSLGICAVGTLEDFEITDGPVTLRGKFERFLAVKKAEYSADLSENNRGIIKGVLFGDDGELDENVYEEFRSNGTAHVLSVSGLHIGVLYSMFQKLSGKTMTKGKMAAMGAILLTMGTLAEWAIPVIRAISSIALSIYAGYADKRYDFLTSTAAIALVMVLLRPCIIFNAGFQMSFMAVAAIGFFMPRFSRRVPDSIALTISANIGLMPYQMYQFNIFSVTSFIANIPVVYLTGILLPLAMADFLLDMAGIDFMLLRYAVEALAYATVKVNSISSLGGAGALDVVSPPLWAVVMFYLLIFFLTSETFYILKARKKYRETAIILALLALVPACAGLSAYEEISKAQIIFVDVGQGDCVHIKAGSKNAMIDGGGSIGYNIGKNTLKPYLLKNGVRSLDLALATHMHTDHYKGLEELYQEGMADSIKTGITAGTVFSMSDSVQIECMWPLVIEEGQDANDNCSVFMIRYDDWKILITGDLDADGEKKMLEYYRGTDKLKADILKIGHHGSATSTCEAFLEAVSPEIGVIQVGKNNYGHPSAKIIEKCTEKDIMLLRNDERGAIGFCLGGDSANFYTMIN